MIYRKKRNLAIYISLIVIVVLIFSIYMYVVVDNMPTQEAPIMLFISLLVLYGIILGSSLAGIWYFHKQMKFEQHDVVIKSEPQAQPSMKEIEKEPMS